MEASSSDTSSARMEAREKRMNARKHKNEPDSTAKKEVKEEKTKLGRGAQQIVDSQAFIEKLKYNTTDQVTSVRTETDDRENRRRIAEEHKRNERLFALRDEAIQSIEQNEIVERKWDDLTAIHMPQQLQQRIDEQRRRCNEILASKDALVKQFQLELKAKDEEYIKMLKREAEDVEALLSRMGQQTDALQKKCDEELEAIEAAHLEERSELLSNNRKEINSLFDKRRAMELQFMEAKEKMEEQYMQEISEMRVKDSEEYNKLKIKLETDIQVLEQQLQEMRATYQLNTEKLGYNYRVLLTRDMENTADLKTQRRRENRLKETLANHISRYKTSNQKFKSENADLTEEYMRATKQYKDLQKKFRHFQVADTSKYKQVWAMHEEEVRDQADTVLEADRIVTEQQLGLQWSPPAAALSSIRTSADGHDQRHRSTIAGATPSSTQLGGDGAQGEGEKAPSGVASTEVGGRVRKEKVRRLMALIVAEASFLLLKDEKVLEVRSQNEAVLRALQVHTDEEMDRLLTYFYAPEGDGNEEMYEEDETIEMGDLGLRVRPDDVVRKIRQYMDDKSVAGLDGGGMGAPATVGAATAVAGSTVGASKTGDDMDATGKSSDMVAARPSRSHETVFWEQMSNAIPERTTRVWLALEAGLQRYNQVLHDRSNLITEVETLREQNDELKGLLNQYLGAEVNAQLQVPPTQMIRLDTGGGPALHLQ